MTITTPPPPTEAPPEARLSLDHTCWHDYEAMLRIVGDRRIRVTYDAGTMEVRMPSQRHEQATQLLGLFVTRLAEELEIPFEPLGTTTWKRPSAEKGLEPDQSYYIQNEAIVREREDLDLERDPPPDLAVEVEISRSALDRMAIYAELGVPEVWRYNGSMLTIHGLGSDGRYQVCEESRCFPNLRAEDVERLIDRGRTIDKLRWVRELREWVRDELLPRRDPGATSPEAE